MNIRNIIHRRSVRSLLVRVSGVENLLLDLDAGIRLSNNETRNSNH